MASLIRSPLVDFNRADRPFSVEESTLTPINRSVIAFRSQARRSEPQTLKQGPFFDIEEVCPHGTAYVSDGRSKRKTFEVGRSQPIIFSHSCASLQGVYRLVSHIHCH